MRSSFFTVTKCRRNRDPFTVTPIKGVHGALIREAWGREHKVTFALVEPRRRLPTGLLPLPFMGWLVFLWEDQASLFHFVVSVSP